MGQTGNLENIHLDLADVTWSGTNLGYSKGGVDVNITQEVLDVVIDDFGDTPVKSYDRGYKIEVVVHMAEAARDKFAVAMPTSTVMGDRIKVGGQAGSVIPTGRLVLAPVKGNLDPIVVYKARPTAALTIPFSTTEVVMYDITFVGLIEDSRADGDRLFRIGGPAS